MKKSFSLDQSINEDMRTLDQFSQKVHASEYLSIKPCNFFLPRDATIGLDRDLALSFLQLCAQKIISFFTV